MNRLAGKQALITGGSSGIGFATARAFVAEGARVAITARGVDRLQRARERLDDKVITIAADVRDLKSLDELYSDIARQLGCLDILFANAGLVRLTIVGSTSEEDFDDIMSTNVKGIVFTVQKALPLLADGASVILNGSVAAYAGTPTNAVYAASKAAVRALARNFSAALAPRQIRVNVVSPGPVIVRDDAAHQLRDDGPRTLQPLALTIPIGRVGLAEEVAQVVLFLGSSESSFLVGSEIVVDGGRTQLPDGAPIYRTLFGYGPSSR